MRKLGLLLLLAGIAFPAFAAKRVTVEQLEQVLAAAHGKSDAEVARQLSDLELTERLSAVRLSRWKADLPGTETRQALIALADVSAFLDLPAEEIPTIATPDIPAQRELMALTVDYVGKTISKLPNFFATRVTTRFEDTPREYENGQTASILYQPLRLVGKFSANVLYRDGQEVVDAGPVKGKKSGPAAQGLTTSGEFGPILATVLVDAAQGKLAWSHWEQGTAGPEAVFRYAVPSGKSHYAVEFCCVQGDNGSRVFQQLSGYHGEIAVDPANGTILRLTLEADLKPTDPIVKANILVEYGPVEIGGKSYLCPVKSVSISQARPPHALQLQDFRAGNMTQDTQNLRGSLQTLLNDVAFEQYHLFRASAHVLSGHDEEPGGNAPALSLANIDSSEANTPDSENTGSTPVRNTTAVVPAASSGVVASSASSPAATAAPGTAVPEISVADSAGLPDAPTTPHLASTDRNSPLQVTTRLVDVGVTAYDKKNHPITDLKPEDFEIDDNGRKQAIRFFNRPGAAVSKESAKAPDQFAYSNRRAPAANSGPEIGDTEGSITILLIDASNLAWADLTYARGQILRFLRVLPVNERVALYVLQAHGFQVLQEGMADHALLAAKLSEWMPSSQDLTRAQAEERRNRQEMDTVRNQPDPQTVNGTSSQAPNSGTLVDPELRQSGGNPGQGTLSILLGAARHLAAIPGHKNLVFVTSDNVLAGWHDKPTSIDKGNKQIDEFALRVHEAMNDAHVTLYPLDASQPETDVSSDVHSRDIELAQSNNAPTSANIQRGSPTAAMQQDLHPIQGPMREVADATGGSAIRRGGDVAATLNRVAEDGQATYLLSFTPDGPADGQYHVLTVKLTSRRGATLRYRTGYQYAKEPDTLKERFGHTIWQPFDANEISVSANPTVVPGGASLKLDIAMTDLALTQKDDRWVDNLDIFLVQRDDDGLHARAIGQTLALALKPDTYQRLLKEGIKLDQPIGREQNTGSVRVVVVDENSGRMGSITLPTTALQATH
jgi:VWFA-related protein